VPTDRSPPAAWSGLAGLKHRHLAAQLLLEAAAVGSSAVEVVGRARHGWAEYPFVLGGIDLGAHILGLKQMGIVPEGLGPELVARLLGVVHLQRPPQRRENRY
jgi:hypothetical protein